MNREGLRRPAAGKIIETLVEALHEGTEDFYTKVYVPGIYRVYLHPEARTEISGIEELILQEARIALQAELDKLNARDPRRRVEKAAGMVQKIRKSKWAEKVAGIARDQQTGPRYFRPGPDWVVEVHASFDPDFEIDEMAVEATLAAPEQPALGTQKATRKLTILHEDGSFSTRTLHDEAPHRPSRPTASNNPEEIVGAHPRSTRHEPAGTGTNVRYSAATPPAEPDPSLVGLALARISYKDDRGPQSVVMDPPEILIGRRDAAYSDVHVQLDTLPDVSRKHLRIRYDRKQDAFFVQDLSSYGTYLDGNRLAPKTWTVVPEKATFGLADVNLFINFERLI